MCLSHFTATIHFTTVYLTDWLRTEALTLNISIDYNVDVTDLVPERQLLDLFAAQANTPCS